MPFTSMDQKELLKNETLQKKPLPHHLLKTLLTAHQVFPNTPSGRECVSHLKLFKDPLKILVISAEKQLTSLYLAQSGHTVFAIEPHRDWNHMLAQHAVQEKLPLTLLNASINTLHLITEKQFDLCIFNNSFYQFKSPTKQLKTCFYLLKNEGTLFFFNESTYSFNTYKRLLKTAGFKTIKSYIHTTYSLPKTKYQTVVYSWLKLINSHVIFFPLLALMKYLSLVQVTFKAQKKDSPLGEIPLKIKKNRFKRLVQTAKLNPSLVNKTPFKS